VHSPWCMQSARGATFLHLLPLELRQRVNVYLREGEEAHTCWRTYDGFEQALRELNRKPGPKGRTAAAVALGTEARLGALRGLDEERRRCGAHSNDAARVYVLAPDYARMCAASRHAYSRRDSEYNKGDL
jgi:hypothetical protein